MKLRLVKPDLYFFDAYNDMMREWCESGTQISPWFLNEPFDSIDAFAKFIQMLDDCEHGILDKRFCSTTSYFVIDESGRLIGAPSLRHHLTVDGLNTWGHIGYGVRPSARMKGHATEILRLMLEECKSRHFWRVLIGAHADNIASCRVIEKNGGILENTVADPDHPGKTINRYWIEV
jgi:predicted acetyltransferase